MSRLHLNPQRCAALLLALTSAFNARLIAAITTKPSMKGHITTACGMSLFAGKNSEVARLVTLWQKKIICSFHFKYFSIESHVSPPFWFGDHRGHAPKFLITCRLKGWWGGIRWMEMPLIIVHYSIMVLFTGATPTQDRYGNENGALNFDVNDWSWGQWWELGLHPFPGGV